MLPLNRELKTDFFSAACQNQAALPLFGGLTWYVTSLMISLKSSSRSKSMPVEEATRVPSVTQTQATH